MLLDLVLDGFHNLLHLCVFAVYREHLFASLALSVGPGQQA